MTSVIDDRVMVDNQEYDASIISRVVNLRRVLRELRDALRDERLNLHQEIEMTILQKFIELRRNYRSLTEFLEIDLPPSNDKSLKTLRPILFDRTNDYLPDRRVRETITRAADHTRCGSRLANVTRISESSPRLHRAAHSNGDTARTSCLACLGSTMYQRTVDELQDELNSFEHRLSASATGSYKRKIYDLEAICCADLNRVKSRFVRSLQAFGNTIDSIEELRSLRINPPPPSPTKNPLTGNNTDACRHGRPTSRNAKHDRSLLRSKSIVMEGNRSLWLSYMCAKRYSDSEMYSKIYRSLKYSENPQIMTTKSSDFNLRHHRSITTIFPSNLDMYHTSFRE